MTSGANEPVADQGKNGHSPFAYYFLKTLRQNTEPYLVPSHIYDRVGPLVSNNTMQTPRSEPLKQAGDEGGQFVFRLATTPRVTDALSDSLQTERQRLEEERTKFEAEREAFRQQAEERAKLDAERQKLAEEQQRFAMEQARREEEARQSKAPPLIAKVPSYNAPHRMRPKTSGKDGGQETILERIKESSQKACRLIVPGMTPSDVRTLLGKPAGEKYSSIDNDDVWTYGTTKIHFDSQAVVARVSDCARADLLPEASSESLFPLIAKAPAYNPLIPHQELKKLKEPPAGYFTVGSTWDEVLAIQGSPTEFDDDTLSYGKYGLSTVEFQNRRVVSWNIHQSYPLKAKMLSNQIESGR